MSQLFQKKFIEYLVPAAKTERLGIQSWLPGLDT